ncbi:MAG: phosphatidylglycerophosphatase A [Planctomycetota bacterium]
MSLPDAAKNRHRAPLRPFDVPTASLSVFGLGFLRPAPGTWGSLPTPAAVAVLLLAGAPWWAVTLTSAVLLVLSSVACVAFGRYAEERFGRKDAAEVVCDETAGVSLALLFVPADIATRCSLGSNDALGAILLTGVVTGGAFVLFRVSDIIKPQPARALEKLAHGWGVLIDDLVAGVYSAVAWWVLVLLIL